MCMYKNACHVYVNADTDTLQIMHLFLLLAEVWILPEKFETLETFKALANFILLQAGTEQHLEKNLKNLPSISFLWIMTQALKQATYSSNLSGRIYIN